MTLNSGIR